MRRLDPSDVALIICAVIVAAFLLYGGITAVTHWTDKGVVYSKEYTPPHSSTWIMPVGEIWIPMRNKHQEKYTIFFRDEEGKSGYSRVPKGVYAEVNIGDFWDNGTIIKEQGIINTGGN